MVVPKYLINKLDGNGINFDGCSTISKANWASLHYLRICWQEDETAAVSVLNLVVVNWPNTSKVEWR